MLPVESALAASVPIWAPPTTAPACGASTYPLRSPRPDVSPSCP